jgi:hypothetical protein
VSHQTLEIGINHHLVVNATQWKWKILKNPKISQHFWCFGISWNWKDFQIGIGNRKIC